MKVGEIWRSRLLAHNIIITGIDVEYIKFKYYEDDDLYNSYGGFCFAVLAKSFPTWFYYNEKLTNELIIKDIIE